MKSMLCVWIVCCFSIVYAQDNITVTLDNKEWKPATASAGIETVMNFTAFTIIGQRDKERLDISIDYNAIAGKDSASFTFAENLGPMPGGASISYAPNGLGKQQWVSASGKLVLSEFNEETNTASGTFEGALTQMLDDNGGFVLTSPRPTMKISGKFEKIAFRKVDQGGH